MRQRDGFTSIRSLFTHGPKSHVELCLEVEIASRRWTYELHLEEASSKGGHARVKVERIGADGTNLLDRVGAKEPRADLRRQTHLEQSYLNEEFEPLVHALRGIRYAHLVPQLLRSASRRTPVFVLRDVDPTPPNMKGRRFPLRGGVVLKRLNVPNASLGFRFRLARHEMEAWLLADAKAFARWLGCPESALPRQPDSLLKPSLEIVALAQHPGAREELRAQLVPGPEATSKYGPGYEGAACRFAAGAWNARRARARSRSLDRCVRALQVLARELA
ncbi:MAG: hypothetical protein HY906_04925 [Deltaproteobacteria bacterium]|nr:hypothetical protein [Deltaproteobacteria bacterium]